MTMLLRSRGVDDSSRQPTVLVDAPELSRAMQEETFGPTLTVTKVTDVVVFTAKRGCVSSHPHQSHCAPETCVAAQAQQLPSHGDR